MNDDPVYQRLRELGWRRPLTPAEQAEWQAWLAAHPEAALEMELEAALNEALTRLPQAPVATNFTARIIQAVEREKIVTRPGRDWRRLLHRLLPRVAVATVLVMGAGGVIYQQYQAKQRTGIGESIVAVVGVPSLPSPEVLEEFETVRKLQLPPAADTELLALMQ